MEQIQTNTHPKEKKIAKGSWTGANLGRTKQNVCIVLLKKNTLYQRESSDEKHTLSETKKRTEHTEYKTLTTSNICSLFGEGGKWNRNEELFLQCA